MKRIIITGAAGFIGFHWALALKKRGDAVLGYDIFNDYYDPRLKERRSQVLEQAGISVVRGDICDFNTLQKETHDFDATHFVHLAAQAGVR